MSAQLPWPPASEPGCSLILIGASWGGLAAAKALLAALPQTCHQPIVFLQHRAADADEGLAALMANYTRRTVIEAQDKEPLRYGHLYLAPPDYHLLVERNALALSLEAPVNHSRPAIDVLFESGAHAWRHRLAAVLLTGASEDGANGLVAVKAAGGQIFVQDPATASSAVMPRAGLRATGMETGASLEAIAMGLGGLKT